MCMNADCVVSLLKIALATLKAVEVRSDLALSQFLSWYQLIWHNKYSSTLFGGLKADSLNTQSLRRIMELFLEKKH